MTELEKLRAIEDIRQLKSRYFRFVDAKDWEGLAEVFCKEAVFGTAQVKGCPLGTKGFGGCTVRRVSPVHLG